MGLCFGFLDKLTRLIMQSLPLITSLNVAFPLDKEFEATEAGRFSRWDSDAKCAPDENYKY